MLKILVAYNPQIDGVDFEKKLPAGGYKMVTVFSGDNAIKFCNSVHDLDILILTSNLEQFNSFETILKIRKSHKKLIIILLLNYFTLGSIRLAVATGCTEVLKFPVDDKEFKALIRKYTTPAGNKDHFRNQLSGNKPGSVN